MIAISSLASIARLGAAESYTSQVAALSGMLVYGPQLSVNGCPAVADTVAGFMATVEKNDSVISGCVCVCVCACVHVHVWCVVVICV